MSNLTLHQLKFKTPTMSNLKKNLTIYILIVSAFLVAILVGPRIPFEEDGVHPLNIYFKEPFGVSLDCDVPEFIFCAKHPQYLLADNAVRQSRPGIILLANLISDLIKPLADHLIHIHPSAYTSSIYLGPDRWKNEAPSVYGAYVIINLCLLILAVFLWMNLFKNKTSPLVFPFLLLIFFNSVVKIFFYLPHTQIFNVLTPIVTYWITANSYEGNFLFKRNTYFVLAGLGFGLVCYGTFIIPAVIFGVVTLLQYWNLNKTITFKILKQLSFHGFIFSAPFVCWCLFVIAVRGDIYFHESATCNQFVWMKSMFVNKGILATFSQYLSNIWAILLSGKEFFAVTAALCLAAFIFGDNKSLRNHFKIAVIVAGISCLFLAAMGFFPWRLAFIIQFPFWIGSSMVLTEITNIRKEFIWLSYLAVMSYGAYIVLMPARF